MKRVVASFLLIGLLCHSASPALAQPDSTEISFWESVRDSKSAKELEAYLKAYPDGKFAPLARIRLEKLKDGAPAAARDKTATTGEPPAHECDRLAASPIDPEIKAQGVLFEDIQADRAIKICREAVSEYPGVARFEYQLARAFDKKKNFGEAFHWYRRAAEKGYARGMNGLGVMYGTGTGVTKSDAEAVKWLQRAADKGDVSAMTNLGWKLRKGDGIEKDDKEAVKWFRRAAENGYARAMINLGFMYEDGRGVLEDDAEAVKWFQRAADKGDARAMTYLGLLYEQGLVVVEDHARALTWYRKAAAKGEKNAIKRLRELGDTVATTSREKGKKGKPTVNPGFTAKDLGKLD